MRLVASVAVLLLVCGLPAVVAQGDYANGQYNLPVCTADMTASCPVKIPRTLGLIVDTSDSTAALSTCYNQMINVIDALIAAQAANSTSFEFDEYLLITWAEFPWQVQSFTSFADVSAHLKYVRDLPTAALRNVRVPCPGSCQKDQFCPEIQDWCGHNDWAHMIASLKFMINQMSPYGYLMILGDDDQMNDAEWTLTNETVYLTEIEAEQQARRVKISYYQFPIDEPNVVSPSATFTKGWPLAAELSAPFGGVFVHPLAPQTQYGIHIADFDVTLSANITGEIKTDVQYQCCCPPGSVLVGTRCLVPEPTCATTWDNNTCGSVVQPSIAFIIDTSDSSVVNSAAFSTQMLQDVIKLATAEGGGLTPVFNQHLLNTWLQPASTQLSFASLSAMAAYLSSSAINSVTHTVRVPSGPAGATGCAHNDWMYALDSLSYMVDKVGAYGYIVVLADVDQLCDVAFTNPECTAMSASTLASLKANYSALQAAIIDRARAQHIEISYFAVPGVCCFKPTCSDDALIANQATPSLFATTHGSLYFNYNYNGLPITAINTVVNTVIEDVNITCCCPQGAQLANLTCVPIVPPEIPPPPEVCCPCENGATCVLVKPGAYSCVCPAGYTDAHCHTDINECADISVCGEHGTCTDLVNAYVCDCAPGWTGIDCSTPANPCISSPCVNGGTCVSHQTYFECQCTTVTTGPRCQFVPDTCTNTTCANGGSCVEISTPPYYACTCTPGYTGPSCTTPIDDCAPNPCLNGGTCVDIGLAFKCKCAGNFTGAQCELVKDACCGYTCLNNGTCVAVGIQPTCVCLSGYTGAQCQTVFIPPPLPCDPQPCFNGGTCINGVGSYACQCPPGVTGVNCETTYLPPDPCVPSNPCGCHGTCVPFANHSDFTCVCKPCWTGPTCSQPAKCPCDPHECNKCKGAHTHCVKEGEQKWCTCDAGYVPVPGSRPLKCIPPPTGCDTHPCGEHGTCKPTCPADGGHDGGFTCTCTSSCWSGPYCNISQSCACSGCSNGAPPCGPHGVCTRVGDKQTCTCKDGYTGEKCDQPPVMPCSSNPCGAHGKCVNSKHQPWSYTCVCDACWTGATCTVETTSIEQPCTCKCKTLTCLKKGTCVRSGDSEHCVCRDGYTGPQCGTPPNTPCASNPCGVHGTCVVHAGVNAYDSWTVAHTQFSSGKPQQQQCIGAGTSFTCDCARGWSGALCTVPVPCRPDGRTYCLNNGVITRIGDTESCDCSGTGGYTGVHCEIPPPACAASNCNNHGTCTTTCGGGFKCTCTAGYSGATCAHPVCAAVTVSEQAVSCGCSQSAQKTVTLFVNQTARITLQPYGNIPWTVYSISWVLDYKLVAPNIIIIKPKVLPVDDSQVFPVVFVNAQAPRAQYVWVAVSAPPCDGGSTYVDPKRVYHISDGESSVNTQSSSVLGSLIAVFGGSSSYKYLGLYKQYELHMPKPASASQQWVVDKVPPSMQLLDCYPHTRVDIDDDDVADTIAPTGVSSYTVFRFKTIASVNSPAQLSLKVVDLNVCPHAAGSVNTFKMSYVVSVYYDNY